MKPNPRYNFSIDPLPRAYGELLFTLVAMDNSKNEDLVKASNVIKTSVFYEPEYRELCLTLFAAFTPDKMSNGFLKDLVETTHVLLKLMEHMSKRGHLVVGRRVKVKKKRGGGGKSGRDKAASAASGAAGGETSMRETNETMWDVVSGEISNLLQGWIHWSRLADLKSFFSSIASNFNRFATEVWTNLTKYKTNDNQIPPNLTNEPSSGRRWQSPLSHPL